MTSQHGYSLAPDAAPSLPPVASTTVWFDDGADGSVTAAAADPSGRRAYVLPVVAPLPAASARAAVDPPPAASVGAGLDDAEARVEEEPAVWPTAEDAAEPDVPAVGRPVDGGLMAPPVAAVAEATEPSHPSDPIEPAAGDAEDGGAASYQSHFLEDGDDDPEFVAHVEPPSEVPPTAAVDAAVRPAGAVGTAGDGSAELGQVAGSSEAAAVAAAASEAAAGDTGQPPVTASERGTFRRSSRRRASESHPGREAVQPQADAPESPRRRAAGTRTGAAAGDPGDLQADGDADADEAPLEADAADRNPDESPDEDAEAVEPQAAGNTAARSHSARGGWTIPLLCGGIALIACCVVIPQADANRRLAYERASLRADLDSVQAQVATNEEFLRKLAGDPTLAERLAGRQLNLQRPGTRVLPIRGGDRGTSPFDLVRVAPPAAVEPYAPVGGRLADVCRNARARLYLTGAGLFVLAAGLVLGAGGGERRHGR